MTGPEHYREAEKLLEHAQGFEVASPTHSHSVSEAQVHALLALAAAVVDGPAVMRPEDRDEWDRATGRLDEDDRARAEEELASEGMETAMSARERAEYDEMSEAYLDAAEEARDLADDGDDYRGWLP